MFIFLYFTKKHFVFIVNIHKKEKLNRIKWCTTLICKIKINRVIWVSFALIRKKVSLSRMCD